jgi:hypothetical protein
VGPALSAIEALSAELERAAEREALLIHSFDTDDGGLARSGHILELRECFARSSASAS